LTGVGIAAAFTVTGPVGGGLVLAGAGLGAAGGATTLGSEYTK